MSQSNFTTGATNFVRAFDSTARSAIGACRLGGERLGDLAAGQWQRAYDQAQPSLSTETRHNATHARQVVGRHYRRGLQLSTAGAEAAVDTLVRAAGVAIERVEGLRQGRASRT